MVFIMSLWNIKVNQVFHQLSVKPSTNVSFQLNFKLFVSCKLKFWPFVSCQLIPSRPSFNIRICDENRETYLANVISIFRNMGKLISLVFGEKIVVLRAQQKRKKKHCQLINSRKKVPARPKLLRKLRNSENQTCVSLADISFKGA